MLISLINHLNKLKIYNCHNGKNAKTFGMSGMITVSMTNVKKMALHLYIQGMSYGSS